LPASLIRSLFVLARIPLSLSVTFSAFVAYSLSSGNLDYTCILPLAAVFFLASGSSVLNQYQERTTDALMDRTRIRPVPAGIIQPPTALIISILFLCLGIGIFLETGSLIPLLLGILTVIFYNGIYTPLKIKTTLALIPGAITGSLPVLIGWTAAGGHLAETEPLCLALFMFFWQVPHFWLLELSHDSEYKRAGIPVMTHRFSLFQIKRMMLIWMMAASVTSLILVTKGFSQHTLPGITILFLNFIFLFITIFRLFIGKKDSFRFLFRLVNLFLIVVLLLLVIDRIMPIHSM
jgi:heme o synthase